MRDRVKLSLAVLAILLLTGPTAALAAQTTVSPSFEAVTHQNATIAKSSGVEMQNEGVAIGTAIEAAGNIGTYEELYIVDDPCEGHYIDGVENANFVTTAATRGASTIGIDNQSSGTVDGASLTWTFIADRF